MSQAHPEATRLYSHCLATARSDPETYEVARISRRHPRPFLRQDSHETSSADRLGSQRAKQYRMEGSPPFAVLKKPTENLRIQRSPPAFQRSSRLPIPTAAALQNPRGSHF